ncbi:MAG TPA: hypothetical protein DDZ51_26205 [Planctomycetaceae bacterium]|nr:hypothetical protein [Planctomycetaceae bacterium]
MSAATPRSTFYTASGMVPPTAWILVVTVLIPISAVAGMLYSAGIVHVPMVKLRWIGSVGLGWVIGMLAAKVCRIGKVRSPLFTFVTVIVGFLVAYYSAWGIHRALLVLGKVNAPNPVLFALQGFLPNEIASWMSVLFKNGNAEGITGLALIIVWLIECGAIAYFTKSTFATVWDDRPFCETCDQWNEPAESLLQLPVSPDDPSWQSVREGWLHSIRKLKIKENANETVALTLSSCPNCDRSHFLTASGIGWQTNAAGEATFVESKIFQYMSVTPAQITELKELGELLDEAYQELIEEPEDLDDSGVMQAND